MFDPRTLKGGGAVGTLLTVAWIVDGFGLKDWFIGLLTGELQSFVDTYSSAIIVSLLVIVALTLYALAHGYRLVRGGGKSVTPPPAFENPKPEVGRWEDEQDAPIQAYAVSRATLRTEIGEAVDDAVERKVNGHLTEIMAGVTENKVEMGKLSTSTAAALTRMSNRIDGVLNALIGAKS